MRKWKLIVNDWARLVMLQEPGDSFSTLFQVNGPHVRFVFDSQDEEKSTFVCREEGGEVDQYLYIKAGRDITHIGTSFPNYLIQAAHDDGSGKREFVFVNSFFVTLVLRGDIQNFFPFIRGEFKIPHSAYPRAGGPLLGA